MDMLVDAAWAVAQCREQESQLAMAVAYTGRGLTCQNRLAKQHGLRWVLGGKHQKEDNDRREQDTLQHPSPQPRQEDVDGHRQSHRDHWVVEQKSTNSEDVQPGYRKRKGQLRCGRGGYQLRQLMGDRLSREHGTDWRCTACLRRAS